MIETIATVLIPVLVTAAVTLATMWRKNRVLKHQLSAANTEIQLRTQSGQLAIEQTRQINTEGEWKRIIEEKDRTIIKKDEEIAHLKSEKEREITLLRATDEQQELKIKDLFEKHADCQKNEARTSEKLKTSERDRKDLRRQVNKMADKLLELDNLLRGKDVNNQSGSGSHQALLGKLRAEAEEAGSEPGGSLRTTGSESNHRPHEDETRSVR